jgi:AcrR family transcriptional regulator
MQRERAMRINPNERRDQLIDIAVEVAKEKHFCAVSCKDVADRAGCSPGLIIHYFDTVEHLRDRIVQKAVERSVVEVVAQAMCARHPLMKTTRSSLRRAALEHLEATHE